MAENGIIKYKKSEVLGWGIDPLNGFFTAGALSDVNMRWTISNMVSLLELLTAKKCKNVITADRHRPEDAELKKLPQHCMEGTYEAELIDELKKFKPYVIPKRTTNSFVDTGLMDYLMGMMPKVVVTYGVCSNICVMQGVITLSAVADEIGLEKIIVPMDCVTTSGANARIVDEHAFNILRYVPKVEVIPSYRNLGDVLVIN